MFVALGLTIDLVGLERPADAGWTGSCSRPLLAFVVRPMVVGAAAVPRPAAPRREAVRRLGRAEGRGADPARGVRARRRRRRTRGRIYGIVFVVVALSVVVQGATMPCRSRTASACRCASSSRSRGTSRSACGSPGRSSGTPSGRVRACSAARSATSRSASARGSRSSCQDGTARQARGSHVLRAGDEVHVLGDPEDERVLQRLFEGPDPAPD